MRGGIDADERPTDRRASVVVHEVDPTVIGHRPMWASPFSTWAERTPQLWYLSIAACALVFAGHLIFGANTNASSATFAALWLLLGGLSLVMGGRAGLPALSRLLIAAIVCFAGVLAIAASQLAPLGGIGAHALWDAVPAAGTASLDRDATLLELVKLEALAAAFCVGYVVGVSDRRSRLLFFLVIAASIVYAGWAFLQHFAGVGSILGVEKPYHHDRLTASFLSANSAATAFGMLAVVAVGRVARAVKESAGAVSAYAMLDRLSRKGGLAAVSLLLLLTCIMATQSRAGVAVTAAAIILFAAWEVRAATDRGTRARGAAAVVMVAAAAGAVAALLFSGEIMDRLGGALADTANRFVAYQAHAEAFLASPWRGYGLGSFPVVNDTLQTLENHHDLAELNALHNVYLQWLEEAGVAGAALMFACIGCILAHIWGGLSRRRSMLTWLRAIVMASLLVLAHGVVDYALQLPSIAWQWALMLGVAAGIAVPRAHEARGAALIAA